MVHKWGLHIHSDVQCVRDADCTGGAGEEGRLLPLYGCMYSDLTPHQVSPPKKWMYFVLLQRAIKKPFEVFSFNPDQDI